MQKALLSFSKTSTIFLYLLIIIPFFTFAQKKSKSVIGTYSYSDGNFFYQIELKKDSTFTYQDSFKLGSTSSTGKWKYSNDTLSLFDYEKPYTIQQVEEKVLDTLGKNTIIDFIVNITNTPFIIKTRSMRSDYVFVDGERVKANSDTTKKTDVVTDLKIWINNDCTNSHLTDKAGRIKFADKKIKILSTNYNDYIIKNSKSNYFIVTLSSYPLSVSPPTLTWTKWLISQNTLSPIECNKQLDFIKLKR